MDIDDALEAIAQLAAAPERQRTIPMKERAGTSACYLIGGFLKDTRRIADAMEKLATPPELVVDELTADEWKQQQAKREANEERHIVALERLTELLTYQGVVDLAYRTGQSFARGQRAG